jgi:2-dehydro-3-deoxyphosphogalactonate aldolase
VLALAESEDRASRKIRQIDIFIVKNPVPQRGGSTWTFVKLTTQGGITGWGEPYHMPYGPPMAIDAHKHVGQRHVLGADPYKIERFFQEAYAVSKHPDLVKMPAVSAYEMAMWDIVGKDLGKPIYEILGGKYRDKLRTYTYIYGPKKENGSGIVSDRECARNANLAAERAAYYVDLGFTGLKFDPMPGTFDGEYPPVQLSLDWLRQTEQTMAAVRAAVGDRCGIGLATHAQMTTSSAIRLAKRVEPYDPLFYEEPVPPENVDEMARVARMTTIPIATGERLTTKYEFAKLLEKQAASLLQMDLGVVGGILEAKKIAAMGEAYYAQIAPHLWSGPIIGAASIQLDACTPNFQIQECIERLDGFHADILKKPIRWENGFIIPPEEPGLGVEPNEEVVRKHTLISERIVPS